MPDQNKTELKQEDVFRYIDLELKKSRTDSENKLHQKTKPSFRMVLLVNLLAIAIASSGYLIVNKIFKDQAYQLVGSEKSIKGLEDVLLAELQKKANADLINKQKELDDIKKKLTDLNNQMESFRTQQEKKLKEEIQNRENELKSKMEQELKNKTGKEKQEIEEKYKLEMNKATRQLQEMSLQKEEEYKKLMEEQKNSLIANQQQNQQALQKAKSELASTQEEFRKKLEEEKSKSQSALREVSLKLDEKQKADDFYFQINSLFQNAISYYQKRQYDEARKVLNGVQRLYQNKPDDVIISPVKKEVDLFFVDSINDYLSIKENTKGDDKSYQEYLISIQNLQDFSAELKKGIYNSRTDLANKKIDDLKQQLPQVFDFYSSFSGFQVLLDDINAQKELTTADNAYAKKDYEKAASHYLNVLQNQPRISSRPEVLSRLSTSLLAGGSTINPETLIQENTESINKKAEIVYNQGLRSLDAKNWNDATTRFETVILEYPTSSYTKEALNRLSQIRVAQLNAANTDLDKAKREQELKSRQEYDALLKIQNKAKQNQALQEFIVKYPFSTKVSDAVSRLVDLNITQNETATNQNKVDEKLVNTLLNNAQREMEKDNFTSSLKILQDIVLNQPFSTNINTVLGYMDDVYNRMLGQNNTNLQQIQQIQNEQAQSLLKKAQNLADNKDYSNSAKTYSEILLRYPLSQQVEETLQGLQQVYSKLYSTSQPDLQQINKQANTLYQTADSLFKQGKLIESVSNLTMILVDLKGSDYNRQALDLILRISSMKSNGSTDILAELKKQQDISAGKIFARAQQLQQSESFEDAGKLYSDIINNYPFSSYILESVKGIQVCVSKSAEKKIQENPSTTQTALFLTKNVGRVIDIIDNEIILDIFSGISLDVNDEVYIMRKQNEKILFYVGEARINKVSPVMSKALVTKEVNKINLGDLIFMK